jgi:Tfp pilus assembly protein PilF
MVLVQSASQRFEVGDHSGALAQLREAVTLSPDFVDAQFALGRIIRESGGDTMEALRVFRRALNLDPERAAIHYEIGLTQERAGKMAEAFDEFRAAVEMAPCYVDAHRALGRAALEIGDLHTAASQFRTVLVWDPQQKEARRGLEQTLAEQSRSR